MPNPSSPLLTNKHLTENLCTLSSKISGNSTGCSTFYMNVLKLELMVLVHWYVEHYWVHKRLGKRFFSIKLSFLMSSRVPDLPDDDPGWLQPLHLGGLHHPLHLQLHAGRNVLPATCIQAGGLCTAKTKCWKFETNIPRKGISGPQSQFPHSCVC